MCDEFIAVDEVHHGGAARDEGHHGAGDDRNLGHHGPSGRRCHWPHRKRHAAPFCREPRPTKARVRQRGGLLTRPPSRGRERQLAPRRHAEPSHVSPRGSSTVHAMDPWILEPQTAGETRIFLESWPLSFLRAGPPKSRKKAGESRTHPNLETNFAKLRPGPNGRAAADDSLLHRRPSGYPLSRLARRWALGLAMKGLYLYLYLYLYVGA